MTAGGGIQHAEMFPLLDDTEPNTLELFQIWMNLPAADKMVDAHFTMLWDHEIPRHVVTTGPDEPAVTVTVIAGSLGDSVPRRRRRPRTRSRPDADVALWHVVLEPGSAWTMPAAGDGVARVLYVFQGDGIVVDGEHGRRIDRCRRRCDARPDARECGRHRDAGDAGPPDR